MKHEINMGSFETPADWSDDSVFRFAAPVNAPSDPMVQPPLPANVSVVRAEAPQGIDALIAWYEDFYSRQSAGFAVESKEPWKHPTLGAAPALDFTYEARPGERTRMVLVCAPAGAKVAALFTFCAGARDFEKALPAFREMLASFRPK